MRCLSCDCELTDFEATRKSIVTGEFIDLCARCFSSVGNLLDTRENFRLFDPDLDHIEDDAQGTDLRYVEEFVDDYSGRDDYED